MANQELLICDESFATVSGIFLEPNLPVSDEIRMNPGGTNAGGYGRRGGSVAFGEFTEPSRVMVENPGRHDPI